MINKKLKNLRDQKVGVLGLGDENVALVKFLNSAGIDIVICDEKSEGDLGDYREQIKNLPVQFRLGPHYLEHLEDFKVVFRTPGLPYFHPKIQKAKESGVEVSSQTKLFFSLCPCPIIGITGTKGKGTTATLISKILKWKIEALNPKSETNLKIQNSKNKNVSDLKPKVFLGGNIGTPPIEFLDKLKPEDIVVLELSSFQLQDMEESPHIAVILDIKVDHLDYHKDEAEYIEAKRNIVRFQKKDDFACINADYLTSFEFAVETSAKVFWFSRRKSVDEGCWVKNNQEIILRTKEQDILIAKTSDIILRGEHNLENICAAIVASHLVGAEATTIQKIIKSFKGLEHRLEFVKSYNNIKFYNDSFSTIPDTTIAAIKSFPETPIILLVGGSEKNADYHKLGQVISKSSVKAIINIGLTGERIIANITNPQIEIIKEIQSMDKAMALALRMAKPDDVVLLSPASASFDKYKNYKARGDTFKKIVLNL